MPIRINTVEETYVYGPSSYVSAMVPGCSQSSISAPKGTFPNNDLATPAVDAPGGVMLKPVSNSNVVEV